MSIYYDGRAAVLEAIETGVKDVDTLTGPHDIGPVTFDRIDYPYCEVLPESTDQQDGNDYAHSIRINCYFQRKRGTAYLDQLRAAMDAVEHALAEVSGVECVYAYRAVSIEDFAGELDNTSVLLISTAIEVGTLIDISKL